MNRAMILPAAIAAGLHIAVLGFKASPRPLTSPPEKPAVIEWTACAQPIEEEQDPPLDVSEESSDEPTPPPSPEAWRGAELMPLDIADITRPTIVVKPSPFVQGDATTMIPSTPGGSPARLPGGAIDIIDLENNPRALVRTSPRPPRGFNEERAAVTVEFIVGKDGRVLNARVVSATHGVLEEPCLREIRRWRFEPGIKDGLPVPFRVRQEFVFTVRD